MTDPTGPASDHTNRPATPSPEPAAKKRTAAWIVAALFVVGAGFGAYSMNAQFNEADEAESGFPNLDAGVSATEQPGMTNPVASGTGNEELDKFRQLPFAEQINKVGPVLRKKRQASLDAIRSQLPNSEAPGLTAEEQFAQVSQNYNSVDLYTLYQEKDQVKRREGISGVYVPDPEGDKGGFESADIRLKPGGLYDLDVSKVTSASPVFAAGEFPCNYMADNRDTQIVRVVIGGVEIEKVMSMYRWGPGESVNWVVVCVMQKNSKHYVFGDLARWQPPY